MKGFVAKRYARALYLMAVEEKDLDGFYSELKSVENATREIPEFRDLFYNPTIPPHVVKNAIALLKKELGLRDSIHALLNIAADKKRLMFLGKITAEFEKLYDLAKNRVRVEVSAASALSEEARKSIETALAGVLKKEIVMSMIVNPELIGGVVLQAGDVVVDGSVKSMLAKIGGKIMKEPGK